jgi:hypothetical protein
MDTDDADTVRMDYNTSSSINGDYLLMLEYYIAHIVSRSSLHHAFKRRKSKPVSYVIQRTQVAEKD